MQQKPFMGNFFKDMQSTLNDVMDVTKTSNPFSLGNILDMQRKNMQAFTEANQRAMSGWQTMAQRQSEMFSQFMQDNTAIARETLAEETPQGKMIKQMELMKSAYERSMANTQEMADMICQCSKEAADVITQRVISGMGDMKAADQD